ncbi:MAG TPA: HD-GYP domain-containing protein [Gaiellaceae bacterium]|nr:HD-GYP domain-containing protein [Gaiellaceae bacterium]
MRSLLGLRAVPALVIATVAVALPFVVVSTHGHHKVMLSGTVHFWAIWPAAAIATAAAIVLTIAGARRKDSRTVIMGTAFAAMALLLSLHGIASPGVLVEMNGLVAFTGGATLPLGAAILALTALPSLQGPQNVRRLLLLQAALLAAIALLGIAGMISPDLVPSVPEPASPTAIAILAAGLALYAFLAYRAVSTVLLTRRGADLMVVLGLFLLAVALTASLLLDYWDLGWWLGHGLELAGILLVGIPVAVDLHRATQSRPLTGGPRAGELIRAEQAFLGARVRALTMRLAEKDEYTEGHTRRVALRAVLVGEELGLAPSRLRNLATGGLLHDIGKLSVPDEILKKPGSLDDAEFAVIKRHPEWGHKLLGELGGFSDAVRRLVLDHHERLDGNGYPNGRSAADLDIATRILTVCDVYDALLSVRVYRDAWTHAKAMELLHEQTGCAFDAACVKALERVLARDASLSLGVAV